MKKKGAFAREVGVPMDPFFNFGYGGHGGGYGGSNHLEATFCSQTPKSKNQRFPTCKQPVDQFAQAVSSARLIVLSIRNGTALHQHRASICPPVAKPRVVSEGDVGNAQGRPCRSPYPARVLLRIQEVAEWNDPPGRSRSSRPTTKVGHARCTGIGCKAAAAG